ncbi:MAG: hypothetical protein QUS14_00410, partial [Pyrinomonadaceae bacterium]|nr:hypothetical protein [Pyrinomonadaceae bacterium]
RCLVGSEMCIRDRTGPDKRPVPPDAEPHGNYFVGFNKDSPERPRWDDAYVFAYAASHELLDAMEQWANDIDPDFWRLVQAHKAASGDEEVRLIRDYGAARNISMWFDAKGQNGIWKGHGSGSSRYFAAFSSKWLPAHRSFVMEEIHDGPLPLELSADLYTGKRVPITPLPKPFSLERRALLVRITYVGEEKGGGLHPGRMLSVGGSDFYSKIIIDGQEFLGKTIQNKREAADPWFEIYIYDAKKETIPITLSVWDEDGIDPAEDRPADINPKAAAFGVSSVFKVRESALLGEINGVFDTADRQFDLQGAKPDETRARIRGYITTRSIR